MDEGQQNSANTGATGAGATVVEETSSSAPIIGAIVILAIVLLGGLYFWVERAGDEAMVENIKAQSGSDDTASIEADLYETDIDSIDAELNAS
ncbi:MAG: hypothetical protein WD896_01865 [Parcubacteria group bacterium]